LQDCFPASTRKVTIGIKKAKHNINKMCPFHL
jgi:hypothetical protein